MTHSFDSLLKDNKIDTSKLICMLIMSNSYILKSINSKINSIDKRVRQTLWYYNISKQKSGYEYLNCCIDKQPAHKVIEKPYLFNEFEQKEFISVYSIGEEAGTSGDVHDNYAVH